MCDYTAFLGARLLADMRASDRSLPIRDRHYGLCHMEVSAWVRHWLHCSGHRISVSRCVSPEPVGTFFFSYEEFEYEKNFWPSCKASMGRSYTTLVCNLLHCIVNSVPFYSQSDFNSACVTARLPSVFVDTLEYIHRMAYVQTVRHSRFARSKSFSEDLGPSQKLEGSRLLCAQTLPVLTFHSGQIL